jgi:hypothetical protein
VAARGRSAAEPGTVIVTKEAHHLIRALCGRATRRTDFEGHSRPDATLSGDPTESEPRRLAVVAVRELSLSLGAKTNCAT